MTLLQTSWNTTTLNPSAYTSVSDYSIGSLSLGSHTVTITTDSGNSVVESSEGSGSTFTVRLPIKPALRADTSAAQASAAAAPS